MAGSNAVGLFVAGVDAGVRNSGTLVCDSVSVQAGIETSVTEGPSRYATSLPFSTYD
jgi:hypothetical protein